MQNVYYHKWVNGWRRGTAANAAVAHLIGSLHKIYIEQASSLPGLLRAQSLTLQGRAGALVVGRGILLCRGFPFCFDFDWGGAAGTFGGCQRRFFAGYLFEQLFRRSLFCSLTGE